MEELKKYIRSVPDFPKPGINFYDITSLLQDPHGFDLAVSAMEKYVRARKADKIVAVEARGFVFGAVLADRLHLPLVPARKPGKLPYRTVSQEYSLEYGTGMVEIHGDAVSKGERVVVVDDLIATGGTLAAVCKLVERLGGKVVGISSVIGLTFLPFEAPLAGYDVNYLISYDSE
ncbi:MAG TPA: adenine phosphoribosyltransferase [Acidobacteriota bacterium]|nr:adenine phosphoribosyltransferase [Acidobacteriota bacterium]